MVSLAYNNAFQKNQKNPPKPKNKTKKTQTTAPSFSAEKNFKVFKKFKSVFKKGDMKILTQRLGLEGGGQGWAVVAAQATCGGAFLGGLLTQVPTE